MADTKISELPEATYLANSNIIPIVQSESGVLVTKKTSLESFQDLAIAAGNTAGYAAGLVSGAEAGADAGASAGADAASPYAAAAQAAAYNTAASVANAAYQRETLAELSAITGVSEGHIGVVYGAGADRGQYRYLSGAWVYEAPTVPDLAASVETLTGTMLESPLILPEGTATVPRSVRELLMERVTVGNWGAVPDAAGVQTAQIAAAIADPSIGRIIFPKGTFTISDDIIVSRSVQMEFEGTRIVQATHGRGFLQFRGDNIRHRGEMTVAFEGTRTPLSARYRAYTEFQRMCAIWVEGNGCEIQDVRSENMFNTVCVRGPVVRNPAGVGYTGADTDPSTAYLFDTNATDNRVGNISAYNQDFALTGHQQTNLTVDGVHVDTITNAQGIPPHGIYMTTPGGATGARCYDVHIRKLFLRNNIYGVAWKFLYMDDLSILDVQSYNSSGTLLLSGVNRLSVGELSTRKMRGRDEVDDETRWAIYCLDANGFIHRAVAWGEQDHEVGLLYAGGASDIVLSGAMIRSRFPVGSTKAAIVRTQQSSVVRVSDLFHDCQGADAKEILVATDSSSITCDSLRSHGTARAAYAEAAGGTDTGSMVHFGYDPALNLGLVESTMLSGDTTRITYARRDRTVYASTTAGVILYGSTTAGSHGFTARRIRRERRGYQVDLSVHIRVNGAFDGTGDVRIGPLPEANLAAGVGPAVAVLVSSTNAVTIPAGSRLEAAILAGENFVRLRTVLDGVRTNLPHTALGTNAEVQFRINYETDA